MSNATRPQVLVCTRFGIGVTDEGWFRHRIPLFRGITAPSLLNQSDTGFLWAIFCDPDLPSWARRELEEALDPFDGRAILVTDRPHAGSSLRSLAKEAGLNDWLLTGRIDDDDAWHSDVVKRLREAARDWRQRPVGDGAIFTFTTGYEWIMYDMIDVTKRLKGVNIIRKAAVRELRQPLMSMSIFALSPPGSPITVLSVRHPEGDLIGHEADYNMVQIETDEPMWLYCRHKQTDSTTQKARGSSLKMSVRQLAEVFRLNAPVLEDYIAAADDHAYMMAKRSVGHRIRARRALDKAEADLAANRKDSGLRAEVQACRERLDLLSVGMLSRLV